MKIGKYTLEADRTSIELRGKGQENYYFSSVGLALKFLVDEQVRESQLTDLKTVVKKQSELYQLIKSLPPITVYDIMKIKKGKKGEDDDLSTSDEEETEVIDIKSHSKIRRRK